MLRSIVDSGRGRVPPPLDRARLLALAAHELRSPVSVISGYLRMLRRDEASPLTARQQQILGEAERSCLRLTELVNQMSELSALDSAADTDAGQPFDIIASVREAAAHTAREDGPPIDVRCAEAGVSVAGNPARLRPALAAFIRAVRRERPDAGVIRVDCRVSGGDDGTRSLVVMIGAGIELEAPAPDVEIRREPVDETRAGLGLALPIALAVIARHGGSVHALDTGGPPGRGPIVVSLPVS